MKKNLKGKTGHWSKYGGAGPNVVKEKNKGPWFCQSCGQEFPPEMSPMLFFDKKAGVFLRVCGECYRDGCKKYYQRRGDA